MPTFSTRRRVAFTPRQMYDLVADIERYPEFLPLCDRLTVRERLVRDGQTVLIASMTVAYKLLSETFTTEVTLDPDGPRIGVRYIDGPFRFLENTWRFEPAPEGCDVDFHIAYEFKSVLLGAFMGAVFDQAFRRFVEAFEERARMLYARPGSELAPGPIAPAPGAT